MRTARVGGWLIGLAAFMPSGCSNKGSPSAEESEELVTSLGEIAGTWDIASFDGYTPARLGGGVRQAYVNVSRDHLGYAIGCNSSGNAAHIDREGRLHDDEGSRAMTLRGCAAEQALRDRKFFWFFASKPKVRWAGPQRVEISNGITTLLLERPELRRLSFLVPPADLTGRWVPQVLVGRNPMTGSTGESFAQAGLVSMTPSSFEYTGCGGVRFTFRYTDDGRLVDVVESDPANCGSDFASASLVKILKSNPLVERDGNGIALTAGEYAVTLKDEEEELRIRRNPPQPPPVPATPPRRQSPAESLNAHRS